MNMNLFSDNYVGLGQAGKRFAETIGSIDFYRSATNVDTSTLPISPILANSHLRREKMANAEWDVFKQMDVDRRQRKIWNLSKNLAQRWKSFCLPRILILSLIPSKMMTAIGR